MTNTQYNALAATTAVLVLALGASYAYDWHTAATAAAITGPPGVNVHQSRDEMTDQPITFALTMGKRKGADAGALVMSWHCRDNRLVVLVAAPRVYLGRETQAIAVEYRVPNQDAVGDMWRLDSSRDAILDHPRDVQKFMTAALRAPSVLVRLTPAQGALQTETFDLTGLADAIEALPCAISAE